MSYRPVNAVSALLLLLAPLTSAHAQLIVHEWGTMTTLHAPDGTPQTRLNLIEPAEVLPTFVAHFEPPQPEFLPFAPFAKGTRTPGRPDVTMRLETPVLYFYDPGNVVAGRGFDVRVRMHGGVLNDFYPLASAGMQRNGVSQGRRPEQIALDASWAGTLEWKNVMLDDTAVPPTTSAAVWLAPRRVQATKVRVGTQAEHYLFYRGLANLGAVLDTRHSRTAVTLHAPKDSRWLGATGATISRVWLIDVRADGSLAFATRKDLTLSQDSGSEPLARIERFTTAEFGKDRLAALWESMKAELVAAGLYADEAQAMLTTWQASYFRQPGLRVFYMAPRVWTDRFLPLELSVPHEATRVLVGRIDLMTADETT
jgi:hypothetical protein